jgi:hypothetical protein
MGPSGRKKRSEDSLYLLVGGSRDVYDVTVNFETKNGHWCQTVAGSRCHGNGNGKGQKYGPPQSRDKHNPIEWCKHVQAALAATEALAEASDRTAKAFGRKADRIAATVAKPVAKPAPVAPSITASARERLAAIEAEKAAIVASLNGKLADLLGEFGADAVYAAIDEVRAA